MAIEAGLLKPAPTRLDRYPAKMVSRLAASIVDRYAGDAKEVFDPFCGSGAILRAAQARELSVVGADVNPYAILLTRVKLEGFRRARALELWREVLSSTQAASDVLPISLLGKEYWYTRGVIAKYERLRFQARRYDLARSREGRAILLALTLSARLCSRADQRSPKPFISKAARENRIGRHFCPFQRIGGLLAKLGNLYPFSADASVRTICCDIVSQPALCKLVGSQTHVVTSPPYFNAQDYYRNSKLELGLLEGLMCFDLRSIVGAFIGTERGVARSVLSDDGSDERRGLEPRLVLLEKRCPKVAAIVHRYLRDIQAALRNVRGCLAPGGTVVVVCGDNLVGGLRIKTWKLISRMMEALDCELFDRFGDQIACRALAPSRSGHRGLIKQEIVSAFKLR